MQKSLIVEFGFKKGKKTEAEYSLLKIFFLGDLVGLPKISKFQASLE